MKKWYNRFVHIITKGHHLSKAARQNSRYIIDCFKENNQIYEILIGIMIDIGKGK